MKVSVRRLFVALAIPVVILLVLGLDLGEIRRGWLPTLTFGAYWAALFLSIPLMKGDGVDTATYGWFVIAGVRGSAILGIAWGLLGLVLLATLGNRVEEFLNGRIYGAVSLLLLCLLVGLPAIFRRTEPLPGPQGPIVDPRSPVVSHPPPVLRRGDGAGQSPPSGGTSQGN